MMLPQWSEDGKERREMAQIQVTTILKHWTQCFRLTLVPNEGQYGLRDKGTRSSISREQGIFFGLI